VSVGWMFELPLNCPEKLSTEKVGILKFAE